MAQTGLTVLQVIPELAAGGAERTTLEIAEAIKAAGGRALVVSEGGRLEEELAALGGELIRLPVKSKSPFVLRKNARLLADIIRQEAVDIVHARSRAPAWSALWAARRTDTPFVTTYHGAYGGRSAPKKLYNSVMARGDIVIANSDFIADHVRTTYRVSDERLVTIPRGVDTSLFDPKSINADKVKALREELSGGKPFVFILPGRLTSWKGQEVLINALSKLPESSHSHIAACLIGDAQGRSEYVDSLKERINTLGLDNLVKISGHYGDMPTLYAASDLVLAPSVRPEAFGRIAIEAGAMAKPVIVSDHGGQRETVHHEVTGWRVAPGDADELARALSDFLHLSPFERVAMGQAARDNVLANFTKTRLQTATLAVYDRLLKMRGMA